MTPDMPDRAALVAELRAGIERYENDPGWRGIPPYAMPVPFAKLHLVLLSIEAAEAESKALREALEEASELIGAVAAENRPAREWAVQVRDRIRALTKDGREG